MSSRGSRGDRWTSSCRTRSRTPTSRQRPSALPKTSRQPRSAALLWDLATAIRRIEGFVADKTWDDYDADLLLRSGVERQLEIAGEAMSMLRKVTRTLPTVCQMSTGSSACATS
ncbi:DUF86 domain-containing protein [Nocardioides sp.]|uniref:HepT-like ribonuclease domain-containing protein n=1 Tax=Nocardioides sp. TaxID=35761 RepID=UPI0039E48125